MQTFLPYKSFAESARVLDSIRLGKQRVEALQVVRTLAGISNGNGWANHPATLMWKGYEAELCEYGIAVCEEYAERGFNDNCRKQFLELSKSFDILEKPYWLGDEDFHLSHRSNLIRKGNQGVFETNIMIDLLESTLKGVRHFDDFVNQRKVFKEFVKNLRKSQSQSFYDLSRSIFKRLDNCKSMEDASKANKYIRGQMNRRMKYNQECKNIYNALWPNVPDNLPYIWPVEKDKNLSLIS